MYPRDSRMYKVEEGQDSVVTRWIRIDGRNVALKYYIHSAASADQLTVYQRALEDAGKLVENIQFDSPIGQINFQVVPISRVAEVKLGTADQCAVSESPYIHGLELESFGSNLTWITDTLSDGDFDSATIAAIIRFAREWQDKSSPLHENLLRTLRGISTSFQEFFSSSKVGCDDINAKIAPSKSGYTVWITDISISVSRFTRELQTRDRRS